MDTEWTWLPSGIMHNHGAHPQGVKVGKLLVLEVDHRTGPVDTQVHRDDDPVAVQDAAADLACGLQPLGPRPPRDLQVLVRPLVPADATTGADQAVDDSKTQERQQRESGAQVQLVEEEGVEEVARGILAQWPPLLVTVLRV